MADWYDRWNPGGMLVDEAGDPADPTAPEFQGTKKFAYAGYPWQQERELERQRQEWQARILRENPEDMRLGVQNPDSPNFKSPAERERELEDFMEEYEKELGVFNR